MPSNIVLSFLLPQFLGIIFNWGLFGALIVQVFMYYVNSQGDRPFIQILVYGIFIADIVQTVFLTDLAYHILVGSWGDITIMTERPWTSLTMPMMNGILAATIQIFFAWRIWILTNKSKLGGVLGVTIVVIALVQSIAAIVSGIRFSITSEVSALEKIFVGCVVWLGGSVLCDTIITGSMFYVLMSVRGNIQFKRTDTLLTRLIYMTVQTGILTTFIAGAELILLVAWRDKEFHEAPGYLLGKMYSNALLATLNARATHHKDTDILSTGTLRFGTTSHETASSLPAMQFNKRGPQDVELQTVDIAGTTSLGPSEAALNASIKGPYWAD